MEGIILDEYVDKKRCKLLVINEDGSRDYYIPSAGGFVKERSVPAPALSDHTHAGLSQLQNIITLLSSGITGSKTIGGYRFTFTNGLLTGFEPV